MEVRRLPKRAVPAAGAHWEAPCVVLRRLVAALVAVSFVVLAVAAQADAAAPSILRPASQSAQDIRHLSLWLLVICLLVFVVVEGLLITVIVLFRRRRREEDVRQVYGNSNLEFLWTLIPAILVIIIFTMTIRSMGALQLQGGEVAVKVTGHQWWWEFEYPDGKVKLANEVHIPAGRTVNISLESADVIHSFWVPQLGGKTDMPPGHVNRATFLAATPGVYQGECAEFCGLQHAHMRFDLVVEDSARFSAWLRHQGEPAAEPLSDQAKRGQQTFLSQPCLGCHAIRGTAAAGATAPDLTHVGSRRSIGAGTLPNDPQSLERWIRDPQAVKPGVLMPAVPMTDAQRADIVAYLEGLQ